MKIFAKIICFLLFAIFYFGNSFALSTQERLSDEAQEARAMNLFSQVKCIVCSGQAIESSNTEFSNEMRQLIRQKISAGKSDEEILQELAKEFGDDILLSSSNKTFYLSLIIALFTLLLGAFFMRNFFASKNS